MSRAGHDGPTVIQRPRRSDPVQRRPADRVLYINAKLDGMMHLMNERFKGIDAPLDGMNQRFDDLRDLWRAELHRVEEVLGARLKHLEER